MIDLKEHKLIRGNQGHTWRALEEILAYSVVADSSISVGDRTKYLLKKYKDAKLRIVNTSARAKISNINTLIHGGSFNDNNKYAIDVFNNSADSRILKIYNDVYINFWRNDTLKTANPNIFENHEIKLLCSANYSSSKYKNSLSMTLSYFCKKIEEYKKAMFKYVTPQHYIEHINAIGHLDKIILLSELEAEKIGKYLNPNIPGDICDFMGMFIPGVNEATAKELSLMTNEKVNKKETVILLCPENMEGMRLSLKKNHPTIMDMIDKVFSHEIGHLAFYFYYSELKDCEVWRTIAEKQANWISSISHKGRIDDLIEEVCSLQSSEYHWPILLKQNKNKDYEGKVDGLYLR